MTFLVSAAIFVLTFPLAGQAPSRVSDQITEDSCRFNFDDDPIPNCFVKVDGRTYITPRYRSQLNFGRNSMSPMAARYGLAIVLIGNHFGYVDRGGNVRIEDVQEFDNGPSDFKYGVVPVHIDGSMNFAKPSGKLLFLKNYDWVSGMWHGKAYGCIGCREICAFPPAKWGECEDIDISWVGGHWFRLTPDGRSVRLAIVPKWGVDPGTGKNPTFHR